jgi:acetylornithine/succinyldiaminopimelate/putrescine aminotransferase
MHDVHKEQENSTTVGGNRFACKVSLEAYEYILQSAYRIPCISMQGSYILVSKLLQKQL